MPLCGHFLDGVVCRWVCVALSVSTVWVVIGQHLLLPLFDICTQLFELEPFRVQVIHFIKVTHPAVFCGHRQIEVMEPLDPKAQVPV